jgi:long-chain fatty acid transport protein
MPMNTPTLRAAILATLVVAADAHASGFALLEQSASRLGTAFAGSGAAADDSTTLFFNPAGLVYVPSAEAVVILSGVSIGSEFNDAGSLPALGQPLGGNGGNAGDWNLVPSAYLSVPLGDSLLRDLSIGIGINAPFGLKLEYDDGWAGRFQALNSQIKTTNANPTIAFRLGDVVSIGIGIDYQVIEAELTNAVNYTAVVGQGLQQLVATGQLSPAAVPPLLAANAGLEGDARVRGDDHAWGYNIGFMFEFGEATRVGLAYRSSLDYRLEGWAVFTPPSVQQSTGAAIVAAASAPGGALASGPVHVDLELPDSAILSLRQRFGEKFELLAETAWTGWSSVQELRVVRDTGATLSVTPELWSDTWRFALGGTYALTSTMKLRAGLAYDQTPVPDSTRTPRLPDTDRAWAAIGAHWQATDAIGIDFGYAHLFSDDVPLDQDAGNTSVYGALIGEQESAIDIVSVQMTFAF